MIVNGGEAPSGETVAGGSSKEETSCGLVKLDASIY